jgi:hypothetical protein
MPKTIIRYYRSSADKWILIQFRKDYTVWDISLTLLQKPIYLGRTSQAGKKTLRKQVWESVESFGDSGESLESYITW